MEEIDLQSDQSVAAGTGVLRQGLAAEGFLRWLAADVTELLREVRDRLDLSPVASAALGRSLAGATMMLRLATKTPSRLVLEVRGDGPLGVVRVDTDHEGNVQALVGDPRVEVPHRPDDKLAVGAAVGRGLLKVLREYGDGKAYQSQVALVSGEIGDDLTHYLAQSEQVHSAVLVGVLGRPSGIAAAGGALIEVLPGAPDATLDRLGANLATMPGVSWLLEEGGVERVLDAALAGFDREELERRPLRYRCRCSWDRFLGYLVLLPEDDRRYLMDEQGMVETDCRFCGNHYRFTPADLFPPLH